MLKCNICKRPLLSSEEFNERSEKEPQGWMLEWHIDCGGDCSGCVAVIEDRAVYRHCEFHNRECVVANHYANATHLCSDDACIEHQDITTLMINDSYARWKEGEGNAFFDRITKAAENVDLELSSKRSTDGAA